MAKLELVRVQYIPKKLEPGFLYVSEEFGAAVHLCACGCGSKVSTPIGPTDWKFHDTANGPTLNPSVGNWQLSCKSHYWIRNGEVVWYGQWMPEQIEAGRRADEERTQAYYDDLGHKHGGWLQRLRRWIKSAFQWRRGQ